MTELHEGARVDQVREALKLVIDPELGQNVVDLGLIYDVAVIDDCIVSIDMTTTTRGCPATGYLRQGVEEAAKGVEGIAFAQVKLTYDPPWSPALIAPEIAHLLGR